MTLQTVFILLAVSSSMIIGILVRLFVLTKKDAEHDNMMDELSTENNDN